MSTSSSTRKVEAAKPSAIDSESPDKCMSRAHIGVFAFRVWVWQLIKCVEYITD